MSNQNTLCMEYLLIFHSIMEHVQSWLKVNLMFYCKLYILARLTVLQRANGHLFVRLSVPLVSHA